MLKEKRGTVWIHLASNRDLIRALAQDVSTSWDTASFSTRTLFQWDSWPVFPASSPTRHPPQAGNQTSTDVSPQTVVCRQPRVNLAATFSMSAAPHSWHNSQRALSAEGTEQSKATGLEKTYELCYVSLHLTVSVHDVKGKANSLQAWTGPEGSRRLSLTDFKTIGTWRW